MIAITPAPASRRLLRAAAAWPALPSLLVVRGDPHRHEVALTLDDGPDAMTPEYLDVLARAGVRCTFFLIGENCRARPDLVLEIVRGGHEIGNHSSKHDRFPSMSSLELARDLEDTQDLLPSISPGRPIVRPPHGDTSLRSLALCALAGYRTVLWSLDSGDARVRDPDELVARVSVPHVRRGEIILMHEGQSWTLAALPRIIEGLRAGGLEPVTVGELLAPRGDRS